ncbi:MAG: YicC family protein [Labilithrix sp.]|nr:YicC family protein [Labilithrix sp.]MBX3224167.1 YicC family protein [Labilithrix sp.]
MRSMTGFGVGESALAASTDARAATDKVTVEIRAVNHRFLDVRVRVPNQLPDLANVVETLARERLSRGRFDVNVRVDGAVLGAMVIDHDRARSVFAALKTLRDELAPDAEVPLGLLGSVPDLFVPSIERDGSALDTALTAAFDGALKSLDAMRVREGVALAEDLVRRLGTIRRLMQTISARAPCVVDTYKRRLKERAERLRAASDLELDAGRLEQELALFADRIDVAEELTRLESHSAHFESLLQGADAVGRRLDFLLQEMAREANTIGSKGQDVTIAHAVVELKAEIERMREQVQNLE